MPPVAGNLQLAALAGFVAKVIEWGLASWGHPMPEEIASDFPVVLAIIIAHASDMVTGDNK